MNDRIEPSVGIDPTAEPAPPPRSASPSTTQKSAMDQLARIEEKAARIEEKFARYEAVLGRAQDNLDRAAKRVEDAARGVDAAELAAEVATMRARLEKVPRFPALIMTALATSVVTTLLLVIVMKLKLL